MKLIQSATPAPRITTQSVMYADADVGYWHKADMLNALTNVRFWGQSGHWPTAAYRTRF